MGKKKVKSQADIYWENRTLCSDESCIGVIRPDGHCKECGKKFKGDLPKASIQAETAPPPVEPEIVETQEKSVKSAEQKNAKFQIDEYWEKRTLCSDESCIGVIGPGGRCKECGKLFEKG
jgi:hypothetical protein